MRRLTHLFIACLTFARLASAEEGKWTPQQVLELDPAWLRQMGLELPVERLWDPSRGTGLLAATVNTGGCSGGFVSADGLIATNHHCLFGLVQEHSRPDRDLITNGFIARTRAEELPGSTMRVTVPRTFTDVTAQMEAAADAATSDLARYEAIDAQRKRLVSECEKKPGARCSVAAFDGGLQYMLVESTEFADIRLVYAPPRPVGEFGGEPDNFRWPRHSGDVALARAYVNGQPYKPEFYFPIAKEGLKEGDFVMILGYPGRTMRAMTAAEMLNEERRFELRVEVYGEWLRLLDETTKGKPDGEIAVAATAKSLANTHTNAQGQLAGLARGKILDKQTAADAAVTDWARTRPEFSAALAAKQELDQRAAARAASAEQDFVTAALTAGPLALKHALTLVRLSTERIKPDEDREIDYQAREWPRIKAMLGRDQQSYFRAADEALFASLAQRSEWLRGLEVKPLYDATKITDRSERLKMFDETAEQLRARRDPLLDLAFRIDPQLRAWQTGNRTQDGAITRLRPDWRRAVIAHAGAPVAPDANSTLRVSFAHVEGYVPRDGVMYTPFSTVAGMLEKHTGQEPFNASSLILDAAKTSDPALVPLNFLSNADTTGGNSGSPVVNGRGELVGLNFDRVWENVANDFGYNPAIARNISVDIRFLKWLLGVQGAGDLARELGLQ